MFSVFLAAISSWLLLLLLIPHLRLRLLDDPNERSSHRHPTPRGGGIAFVAVASASSGFALIAGETSLASAIPLLAAPLSVVGLLDDRYNLPVSWRYGVQLLTSALILGFSPLVQRLGVSVGSESLLLLPVLLLLSFTVTAVINFINFMDGLDGLVAGCLVVCIAAPAASVDAPWSLWALVGSLIGFLFWNWSPAKVFMGDVGSTFLGAVFAGLLLQTSSWLDAFGFLLVATPLLADACLCVVRRLFAGQRVFQAHRLHLFQRLYQAGWPHARVSFTYLAATAVLAVAMLAGGWLWVFALAVLVLLLGVCLDQWVAVPFSVACRS